MATTINQRDWISAREVARLVEIHHLNVPRFCDEAKVRRRDLPGGFRTRYSRADVEQSLDRATKGGN